MGLPLVGCGAASGESELYESWLPDPGQRPPAFLAFPPEADSLTGEAGAAELPGLLSETLAFVDTARLEPRSGLLPYEIQAPLWSDGAYKQRWLALPEGTQIAYSETEPWQFPEGTVFVKHFEMAMDERLPEQRHRLETRFWIVGPGGAQYGASYKWNEAQTDAELVLEQQSETLSITDERGEPRSQQYFFPGPAECFSCHNSSSGFVLGPRLAQLNRSTLYAAQRPAVNQLVAWSGWGYLDSTVEAEAAENAPRLAALDDESASLEDRVRSYWDGNCSMCHAGADGSVAGWDARFSTPVDQQGLSHEPARSWPEASRLIEPGDPEHSLIYLRGGTTEPGRRMPPLGRNRVDELYLDLLASWITSLE